MAVEQDDDSGRTVPGRDINISTIVVMVGVIATGIAFVVQARSQADQANKDITRLEQSVNTGFESLRREMSTLPDTQAHVADIERRLGDNDRWHAVIEDREGRMRDDISKLQADVAGIHQASNQSLLPAARDGRR